MDCSLPVVPGDGDLRWSDSHSLGSDEVQSVNLPSPWLGALPTAASAAIPMSTTGTVGFAHTGQLSPVSNGVDGPCGATDSSASIPSPSLSPPVTAVGHPAPSSVDTQSWTVGYATSDDASEHADAPESHGNYHDVSWDENPDEILAVPKIEPIDDDDFCMDDLKEAPSTPVATTSTYRHAGPDQPKAKRPRGRPRKHPLTPIVAGNKITKGRSKTGCLTCRKRKKKCDEAKPRCMFPCHTPNPLEREP